MPYALCFYLYLLAAGVVVVGAVWLSPLGLAVNIVYALVVGYLGIVVGRRVLGRKNL